MTAFEREDLFRSRGLINQPQSMSTMRTAESAAISADIEAFLLAGGCIRQIPTGQSGDLRGVARAISSIDTPASLRERSRQAAMKAREVNRQSGEVQISAAARHLGISPKELRTLCDMGQGPKHTTARRGAMRFLLCDLDSYRREVMG